MEIDNSAAEAFRFCPWYYFESYLRNGKGIQPKVASTEFTSLAYGGRVHELLEEYYKGKYIYPPHPNGALEAEAQWSVAAYKDHYPSDTWEVIDVERTLRVRLPGGRHIYCCKLDLFVLDHSDGSYWIIDHKTEKRGSRSHTPQRLAVADQGSLYIWAARKSYPQVDGMKYNILTRPSEKHEKGPTFPDRYPIDRSEHEIGIAVRDINYIADQIEFCKGRFGTEAWPANRDNCTGFGLCDFYQPHRFGEDVSLILQHKFEPKEEYLKTDGVEVIE